MKVYGQEEVKIHELFTSSIAVSEWSVSRLCREWNHDLSVVQPVT
jgi:hypothetical protein